MRDVIIISIWCLIVSLMYRYAQDYKDLNVQLRHIKQELHRYYEVCGKDGILTKENK